ncbi:XrtA system polysaccharide deacetylase [Thiocystis violacea]|uniref:XrtA system polysaccharide deacetylase n=1 Tax=Thiocystis violacea TaxID=13725 RepID=UPI001F5B2407|nr:XrtA system polysaccharide deacetylase [Thiocystis violacea]
MNVLQEHALDRRKGRANAMTIDVEDYYQVSAFESHVSRDAWPSFATRIERNLHLVLTQLAEHGVSATFFTLGCVAERHPGLIRELVEQGHELASHGYSHVRVTRQDRYAFFEDICRTKSLLEDIAGVEVKGYRAASYSIDGSTPWAHEALRKAGYGYSSSVYPIRHDHYGMPEAPRFRFNPIPGDSAFIEIPISTIELLGRRIPCGGGGYFRLYPYGVSRWAFERLNRLEKQAGIFYFHPWEMDPEQPRVQGLSSRTRFRHYLNLSRMESRVRHLLRDFTWDRMDRIFLPAHPDSSESA